MRQQHYSKSNTRLNKSKSNYGKMEKKTLKSSELLKHSRAQSRSRQKTSWWSKTIIEKNIKREKKRLFCALLLPTRRGASEPPSPLNPKVGIYGQQE